MSSLTSPLPLINLQLPIIQIFWFSLLKYVKILPLRDGLLSLYLHSLIHDDSSPTSSLARLAHSSAPTSGSSPPSSPGPPRAGPQILSQMELQLACFNPIWCIKVYKYQMQFPECDSWWELALPPRWPHPSLRPIWCPAHGWQAASPTTSSWLLLACCMFKSIYPDIPNSRRPWARLHLTPLYSK